jgi:hypothetical protein
VRLAALRAGDAAHLRRVAFSLEDERPRGTTSPTPSRRAALRTGPGPRELSALEELTAGRRAPGGRVRAGSGHAPAARARGRRRRLALGELRVLQGRPPARSGLPDVPGFEQAAARLDRYLRPTVPLPPED